MSAIVTRFAPSPSGHMHLGHAYAALFAERAAKEADGRFLVRIEDIDRGRCRPEFETAIFEDLAWLGLAWETPVRRQSEHMDDYAAALAKLDAAGLLYPCFCTRADILAEIEAAGRAPHEVAGPDGPIYPGTCTHLSADEAAARRAAGEAFALRLHMDRAVEAAGPLTWLDDAAGAEVAAEPGIFGDVVLARKDVPTSYHLAVTVDDDIQGVTLVTRGEDLWTATHIHRLLQGLLGLATPAYRHHGMLSGPDRRRLAKRDKAMAIRELRAQGVSAEEVRAMALADEAGGAP